MEQRHRPGGPGHREAGLRVVVTGATGNVGTSVVRALAAEPRVGTIVGLARRRPRLEIAKLSWETAEVTDPERLARCFDRADAVVHLAWMIQPSRDREALRRANVAGSERVFAAVARAGAPVLVYASSIGAYSPGPKRRRVDEGWPTEGIESSAYAADKAAVERRLDAFEAEHPEVRVVRLRPGLIFKREAATEIRRYFLGPLVPRALLDRRLLRLVPRIPRLRFQAVHADDVAEAYRRAVLGEARGAFNIAAEPVLDPDRLAELLGAHQVAVAPAVARRAVDAAWRLRLIPIAAGWVEMALAVPLMDTTRAREQLGWTPRHAATDALLELLDGLRDGAGAPTPPLDPKTSGPLRVNEWRAGVGGRSVG